jgi:hypothetical protein
LKVVPAPDVAAVPNGLLVLLPGGGRTVFPLGTSPAEVERRLTFWWEAESRRA